MIRAALLLVLFAALRVSAAPSYVTFPSDVDWVTRESDHFRVVYRRGRDELGAKVLKHAEHAYRVLTPSFPDAPPLTHIVLADFNDSLNGYGLDVPFPHIVLFLAPPGPTGELNALDDWLASVVLHEYVHVLHLYPARWIWGPARTIFGNWVLPNAMLPTHFHEGLAVFFETEMTDGGRGRGSAFNSYRRMASYRNQWSLDSIALDELEPSRLRWPMGTSSYFYGYQFYKELFSRRGKDGFYDLVDEFSGNWPFLYGIPLNKIYATDYTDLWTDIYKKGNEESKKEIAQIEKEGVSAQTPITKTQFYKWDLTLSPDGKKFAFRKTDPYDGGGLMIHDTKTGNFIEKVDLNSGGTEGICWVSRNGHEYIVFLRNTEANSYALNYLGVKEMTKPALLKKFDTDLDGKPFNHLQALGCNQDLSRMVVYREEATEGSLYDLAVEGNNEEWKLKSSRNWKTPQGTWVTSIFTRGDETWFLLRHRMRTDLYEWKPGKSPTKVATLPGHAFYLRASSHPGEFNLISNVDGRDEVWEVKPSSKRAERKVALLGGASSFADTGNEFLVASYDNGGYDVVRASPAPPKTVALNETPENNKPNTQENAKISAPKEYNPWNTLYPHGWVPNVMVVPNGYEALVWVPGFDISQKHLYNILAGYDSRGMWFWDSSYVYRSPFQLDFDVDLFNSPNYLYVQNAIAEMWGGTAGASRTFNSFLGGDLSVRAGWDFHRRETAPIFGYANRSSGPRLSLSYKTGYKTRPLGTAPIRGTTVELSHGQYFETTGSSSNYYQTTAGIETNIESFWLKEHTFFFALRGGYTEGNSFYDSAFSGGGEYLLSSGRGYFLNRGFYPGQFIARRLLNLNAEYRFPLAHVYRGIGLAPFQLKDVHAALICDVTTDNRDPANISVTTPMFQYYYWSYGAELKSNWTFLYYLPTQIRLGVYHGVGPRAPDVYVTLGFEASFL